MKANAPGRKFLHTLRRMNTKQILKAIALAKTGDNHTYKNDLPGITKRETREQLAKFIRVAKEGKQLKRC